VPHTYSRKLRVADLLKHQLAELLINTTHDPRFKFVSISAVEISRDYSYAKVFVTTLDDSKVDDILKALNKAAGFLRYQLAQTVNLRRTPKLHFFYDETIYQGQKISELLQKPDTTAAKESKKKES
jgi:ribosome-binding factor A